MSFFPHFVLTEAFSPRHIGNWALVECAVRQLKHTFPQCQITILARDPAGIAEITGERCLQKIFPEMPHHASFFAQFLWLIPNLFWTLSSALAITLAGGSSARCHTLLRSITFSRGRRESLQAFLDADMIISIAGESINDHFYKKLPFVLFTYWLAARLGKKVVLFPQSFGPLRHSLLRRLARGVLNQSSLLMPRDQGSERLLLEIGVDAEKVHFVPDVALAQEQVSRRQARALLQEFGVDTENAPKIAVIPATFHEGGDKQIEVLAGALRRWLELTPKSQLLVFIGNRRGGICKCSDREKADRLVHLLGENPAIFPFLDFPFSPSQMKGIFSELDLVISCRMHMVILSTMAGTPTLAVANQPKINEYMRLCGQEKWVMELERADEQGFLERISQALNSSDEIRQSLSEAREDLQERASMASQYVKEELAASFVNAVSTGV